MERVDAIVDAGRKRARPIIMTTIAMAAGMLPSANGIGEGGEFRAPMATAVIGGLIASTILSLVFVPSFYIVMDDVAHLFRWLFGRFLGAVDEPASEEVSAAEIRKEFEQVSTRLDDLAASVEEEKLAKLLPKPRKQNLKLAAE
jgi:hypothetical protein